MLQGLRSVVLLVCGLLSIAARAADAPVPEKGETQLDAAQAGQVLARMAERFARQPALKARIVTEMEDLIGTRKEEGELLLDRPGRMLRKFAKPALRVQMLNDTVFQEYSASLKKAAIKDFSRAPRALRLVRAAFTGEVAALGELFALSVFESKDAASGAARHRLVLTKRPEVRRALYTRIQARIAADGIFFSEIEYQPEAGEKIVERFLDIQPLAHPRAEDFAFEFPAGAVRQTDSVSDEALK